MPIVRYDDIAAMHIKKYLLGIIYVWQFSLAIQ